MRGIKSSEIPNLVTRDVSKIREEAHIVLKLEDGVLSPEAMNPDGRLNIVAIIGPGVGLPGTPVAGQYFAEALLLEVGLRRGRPYNRALGVSRSGRYLTDRWKWFAITDETVSREVMSTLFQFIQKYTILRTANWKSGNTYRIPVSRRYPSRNQSHGTMLEFMAVKRTLPHGIRCTFSTRDEQVVQYVREAELAHPFTHERLVSKAGTIERRLSRHRKGFRGDFWKLQAAGKVHTMLRNPNLSPDCRLEVLRLLSPETKAQFGPYLCEMVGQSDLRIDELRAPAIRAGRLELGLRIVRESVTQVIVEFFDNRKPEHLDAEIASPGAA